MMYIDCGGMALNLSTEQRQQVRSGFNWLVLVTGGTVAVVLQNLRDMVELLGVGPFRMVLALLGLSTLMAFTTRMWFMYVEDNGMDGRGVKRMDWLHFAASGFLALAAYLTALVVIAASVRVPVTK